ncbi:heavy metal translocatin [Vararia minispora EC-137]|uniref:Heavy metal translocatin n=1 Tax=Vararia minispora EC-137 TaxID=1314806 RepID=A0ACB8QYF9_9AGAM|nr:heavy metal translocatin [Vararia minispora EC-137]
MLPLKSLRYSSFAQGPPLQDLVHTTIHDGESMTTTIFVSNLHCSSCVETIHETLSSLRPPPSSVEISIVSQTITIRHPVSLSYSSIKTSIEDAGFNIATQPVGGDSGLSFFRASSTQVERHLQQCVMCQRDLAASRKDVGDETSAALSSRSNLKPKISTTKSVISEDALCSITIAVGGMTCASCTGAITAALTELPYVREVTVSLLGNSATVLTYGDGHLQDVVEAIEGIGYEASIVDVQRSHPPGRVSLDEDQGPYLVSLSIGGMTCASCSTTITQILRGLDGVLDSNVNLLSNSGTARVDSRDRADEIVDAIESAGYEAAVMSVSLVPPSTTTSNCQVLRTVSLQVDGMFCHECPRQVTASLAKFGSMIKVDSPFSEGEPIIRLTYTPSPSLNIRSIIATIAAAKSPPFEVKVYHPPTLEDRARVIHANERRDTLYRLVFTVLVAIPTLIIGIIYMSLVPASNASRVYLMQPMWAGNAARIQWALFFLASPIMFYSAGKFHLRSFKELRALWRKGSRTPVWRRFIRFGSMNLLISSGVTVAYFSSIVLLALATSVPASSDGKGDTTTYFDSVVFLTMFLLIGRYMEAYSKARTMDAITDLARLRPTVAYLVRPADSDSPELVEPWTSRSPSFRDVEKGDVRLESSAIHLPTRRVQEIPVDLVDVGDIVRIQNGSTPPADGVIVSGNTTFNESSLTGESRLIRKVIGDQVFLGTINTAHAVDVRIDTIGGETMLDHITKAVRDGQTKRAPIERVADKLTGYFVPVVTLLAVSTWLIWLGLGYGGRLPPDYLDTKVGGWAIWSLEFAIAVFVVACPCGIGLAAPTALLVGSGLAAKFGILARGGGEAFQEAAQLDVVVFDKTGTLTQGLEPVVTDFDIFAAEDMWNRQVILGIAEEAESSSTHPLGVAIRGFCHNEGATQVEASSFEETPGRGLKVSFSSRQCTAVIGNEKWMEEAGARIPGHVSDRLEVWKSEGKSVVLLAIRHESDVGAKPDLNPFEVVASFAISDSLRPHARDVVSHLQSRGLQTWMISGDNQTTAQAVAMQVGIPVENVIAGVLPHEKAKKIKWLQRTRPRQQNPLWRAPWGRRMNDRCIVAMVGDGINDAPALASADVAIAIGSGSDVALSSASFILMSSELTNIITLFDLSRTVFRRVKFNFLWAVLYNMAALPIAAGVIYPAGHARLDPVWGSLAMALSSVTVVCSSLLLRLYKPPRVTVAR